MKSTFVKMTLLAALLALPCRYLPAQEKPAPSAVDQPDTSEKTQKSAPVPERSRVATPPKEKAVSFIGVLTRSVPQELRAQFGLPEGFGLMVDEVMPETPAQAAGLKVHDVLIKFEDQKLVNMEQLLTLVRSKKKGDVVALSVITGGKETQVSVTVGERMVPVQDNVRRFQPMQGSGSFGGERRDQGGPDMMGEWRESMERFQNRMGEHQERMREWSRDGGRGPAPLPPMFDGPGRSREGDRRDGGERGPSRGGDRGPQTNRQEENREVHRNANVTRSDETGDYRLRREDDRTVFSVKPKEGAEQSWPVNNEEERKAVPEQFRSKLREMEDISTHMRRDGEGGGERGPGSPGPREDGHRPGSEAPRAGGV